MAVPAEVAGPGWLPTGAVPATAHPAHGHLWSLPDGRGLHAPLGSLVADVSNGRLCCHLCGWWFRALGVHVRVHGYTAGAYRAAMMLPPGQSLIARDAGSWPPGQAGRQEPPPSRRMVGWSVVFLRAGQRPGGPELLALTGDR